MRYVHAYDFGFSYLVSAKIAQLSVKVKKKGRGQKEETFHPLL